jgi:serine/threonine protein kinase
MLPLPAEDRSTERLTLAFSQPARGLAERPRYVLRGRLGRGGMGEVYLGTMLSPAGQRQVAIKRLLPRGDESEAQRRLVAEARLVFQLNHANISQVLDLGANERGTFVVMEYVHGLDLAALIRVLRSKQCALDIASAIYIAREVARALDYAHRRVDDAGHALGLVHGDVTPQNILLSVEGEVKLTDFGIAHALGTLAPGSRIRGGTPGYMAPETRRQDPDHRADIYGLGMTLCAALTGSPEIEPRFLRASRPDATSGLCAIIERATAERPERRFLSAADFERALALELARRCPSFTPSALAGIVTEHAQGAARMIDGGRNQTITSITYSEAQIAPPRTQTLADLPPPRRWKRPALLAVVLAITAASAAIAVVRTPKAPPPVLTAEPAIEQPAAPAPAAPAPATPPPVVTHPVVTHAPARTPRTQHAVSRPKAEPGYVSVNSTPWGALYVDGRRVADETPVYRLPLTPGAHRISVVFGDRNPSPPQRVIVRPGQTRTLGFER